ncbi:hypothetical protein HAX54_004619 [Datura stramonium]|uniref:Uncharacterized protein n=1 Tax=Datura stramonium TaxID=4076 RepID=A0ABS8T8V6_DATST|nr:hypothetical protein [Datura stramonium]
MDQNQPQRNNKKIKGSIYIPAGTLASLANRRKQHTRLGPQVQTQMQQVPLVSSSPLEDVQEQVQFISTSPVEQVQEELQQVQQTSPKSTAQETNEQSEEQGPSSRKRKRGITQMQSVQGQSEHKSIVLNKYNQPICPTEEVVASWEKYDIPDTAKIWALGEIQNVWRRYKTSLKKTHYEPYSNDGLRMEKRPSTVPESGFKDLIEY